MISKDCFFIALGNALICWDFNRHKRYQLSAEHAHRLVSIIYNQAFNDSNDAVAQDLKRCKVILDSDEGDAAWGWDILSRIFHFGTKDIVLENQPASEQQWAAQYLQHCNEVLDETSPVEQFCGAGSGIRLRALLMSWMNCSHSVQL